MSRWLVLLMLVLLPDADAQPNLVIILADDLGWADVTCNDPLQRTFYDTPAMNDLAARGARFTNAYSNGPNCAPSRAALLTGLAYPRQPVYTVGLEMRGRPKHRAMKHVENVKALPLEHLTIAEVLRDVGYATGYVGKWHLGGLAVHSPTAQGFDVNVGGYSMGRPDTYFSPYGNPALEDGPEGEYLIDRLAREAEAYVRDHADTPFFLMYAPYAPHTPIQAPPDRIEAARTRTPEGGHEDPTYAAMLRSLDDGIARVVGAIDDLGLTDETIIIFASDNGGRGGYREAGLVSGRGITNQLPLRGGKGMLYEGGIRVPLFIVWPGRARPGTVIDHPVRLSDIMPTIVALHGVQADVEFDGRDLAPLLDGGEPEQRDLFWHFPGYLEASSSQGTWRQTPATAMRAGRYKLIETFETGSLQLFDLIEDPGEHNDLAATRPDLAHTLHRRMVAWRRSVDAPVPERKSRPD